MREARSSRADQSLRPGPRPCSCSAPRRGRPDGPLSPSRGPVRLGRRGLCGLQGGEPRSGPPSPARPAGGTGLGSRRPARWTVRPAGQVWQRPAPAEGGVAGVINGAAGRRSGFSSSLASEEELTRAWGRGWRAGVGEQHREPGEKFHDPRDGLGEPLALRTSPAAEGSPWSLKGSVTVCKRQLSE